MTTAEHIKKLKKKMKNGIVKETYYRCVHCGDEVYWNTQKHYVSCVCKRIAVDGCDEYVRILYKKKNDFIIIQK